MERSDHFQRENGDVPLLYLLSQIRVNKLGLLVRGGVHDIAYGCVSILFIYSSRKGDRDFVLNCMEEE